jgi:hypothetical protein
MARLKRRHKENVMKITVGGSMSMTLMNEPYSPIKCESVLHIEREVSDETPQDQLEEKYQNKINSLLEKDLDKKVRAASAKQKELKARLKS